MSANDRTYETLVAFYEALLREADEKQTFTGHVTKVAKQLGIQGTRYTNCIYFLREMGCITQLQRGAKSALSVWQLNFSPTEEMYYEVDPDSRLSLRDIADRLTAVEQQLRSLQRNIGGIDVQKELAELARSIGNVK